jgi:hypothetical protein
MPIEDHPKWAAWRTAFDRRNEAEKRYYEARKRRDPSVASYLRDFELAQEAYDRISAQLD